MKTLMIMAVTCATMLICGCISQEITLNGSDMNQGAEVSIEKNGTNYVYKAIGGMVISMGIYSDKDISPATTATIPLK